MGRAGFALPRTVRSLVAAMAAASTVGCGNIFGADDAALTVSLAVAPQASALGPLRMAVDIGTRHVELTASAESGEDVHRSIGVPPSSGVPVRVTLLSAIGDRLAEASFTQRFAGDSEHWISAQLSPQRPTGFCVGAVVSAGIAGYAGDSLFVAYGGIPRGAIC